jgi:hypothetical protein
MKSIHDRIWTRIRRSRRGTAHVPSDFLDLGGRAAVDRALSRLARSEKIRRVARGVYDLPKVDPQLGPLSPSLPEVAAAIARSTGSRIQLSGAHASNALGLSTQVPAKLVYLTDGLTRMVRVGNRVIDFRHVAPRRLAGAGTAAAAVIQALMHAGPDAEIDDVVEGIRDRLPPTDRTALRRYLRNVPTWVRPSLERIANAV